MGTKLVRVGRKLARVGRRLVTTAGGAPCCCGGGGGPCSTSCNPSFCEQCGSGDVPNYLNLTTSFGVTPAQIEAATEDAYAGYECATCERTVLQVQPWSFSGTSTEGVREFSAPALTLCRVSQIVDSMFLSVLSAGSGTGIWWAFRNYGFGYALGGNPYGGDSGFTPNCAWELTPDNTPAMSAFNVRLDSSEDWLPFVDYHYNGPPQSVQVRAWLMRVQEDKAFDGMWFRGIVGMILVVEYLVTLLDGIQFVVYPAPGAAGPGFNGTDPDISQQVNLKDWGGWISCVGVEHNSSSIRTFNQTYTPCTNDGGCGQVFTPNGATIWQFAGYPELPLNFFTGQWPKLTGGWGPFTNSGFIGTIESGTEYGPSCDDDPLLTLV